MRHREISLCLIFFLCDYFSIRFPDRYYAICGGRVGNTAGNVGAFQLNVNNTAGNANWNIGASLPSLNTREIGIDVKIPVIISGLRLPQHIMPYVVVTSGTRLVLEFLT